LPPLRAVPDARGDARPRWFRTLDRIVLVGVSAVAAAAAGVGVYALVALR
jgi:hypothetical protein